MKASEVSRMIREQTDERYADGLRELNEMLSGARYPTTRAALKHAIASLLRSRGRSSRQRKSKLADDLGRQKAENDRSRQIAANARQRWTEEQDRLVLDAILKDEEIGAKIGRSIKAVRVRRVVLTRKSAKTHAGADVSLQPNDALSRADVNQQPNKNSDSALA